MQANATVSTKKQRDLAGMSISDIMSEDVKVTEILDELGGAARQIEIEFEGFVAKVSGAMNSTPIPVTGQNPNVGAKSGVEPSSMKKTVAECLGQLRAIRQKIITASQRLEL